MLIRPSATALFVTLFIVLTLGGCAKTPQERYSNAKALGEQGKYQDAIIELKSALQEDPNNGLMRLLLGRLYNSNYQGEAAAKELRLARKFGVTEAGLVNLEIVRALRLQGKYEEILKESEPDDGDLLEYRASLHALRGNAFHAIGNSVAAEDSLREALQLQETNPDAQILKAQIAAGKGELEDALGILKKVTASQPKSFDGWSYQAELLYAMGRGDESLAANQQVLDLNPHDLRALMRASKLFLRKGDLPNAEKNAQLATNLYPGYPDALAQIGMVQLTKGEARQALDSAINALKSNPEHRRANLVAAYAHLALDSPVQAEPLLSKSIARFPQDKYARRALVRILLQSGRASDALATLGPLLELPDPDAETLSLAGETNYRLRNTAKAMEYFKRSAELAPQDPDVLARQALAKIGAGDTDDGLDELERAVALTGKATPSDEMLVMAHISHGDLERAAKVVDNLVSRAPNDVITQNLKGIMLLVKDQTEEAAKAFEAALAADPLYIAAAGNLVQIHLFAGKTELAREVYQKMLKKDPDFIPALLALAQLEASLGDQAAAITTYKRAVVADPKAITPRLKLTSLYLQREEIRNAMAIAKETLIQFPRSPLAILLAAKADLANGATTQAMDTISKLTTVRPKSASSAIAAARLQFDAGFPEEAEKTLRLAVERIPESPELKLALTATLTGQSRFDDAREFAAETQRKQPESPWGFMLEAEIFEDEGRYDEALEIYRRLNKKTPSGTFAKKVHIARYRSGDEKGALEELKQWVNTFPDEPIARQWLADALLANGDYKSAIAHYEMLVERNAGQKSLVLNNLAWAYLQTKDDRASATAELALKEAPHNAEVLDTVGWIILEQGGDIDRALAFLERAAAIAPNSPAVRYHLAAALAKKGKIDVARTELQNLLDKAGTFRYRGEAQALLESL